jgi:hypothetical protein
MKMIADVKPLFLILLLTIFFLRKESLAQGQNITIENGEFCLIIGKNGQAVSLKHKITGQECLREGLEIPAFTLTQYRPYDNELQLKYPAKPKIFAADSVYRRGDQLVVSFELINIVATIGLKVTDDYIGFALEKLDYRIPRYGDQLKTEVDELVILQLPVKKRENFGEWLNVVWDDEVAVNLLGTDPFVRIENTTYRDYYLLKAEAVSEVKGVGTGAALITTGKDRLLDCIDRMERDFNLPLGVESRRREEYRFSYYEAGDIHPGNVDKHIAFAKKGGFRAMQIIWTAFSPAMGHFPWREEYPNGIKDLQMIVQKIKDAGMIAGAHFWYNKAMKNDLYVSPVPDHRLNLRQMFTLAAPLGKNQTFVVVEENPAGCTLDDERRILKIGDELIEYEGYTTSSPYQFTGCKRGVLNTTVSEYGRGFKLGLLDVDTWPVWVRFDQRTSIQEEMAERVGTLYHDAGFQFAYFDGAEDIHRPYWHNTSMAQLKVYDQMKPAPLFSEGALKSHFSWHILSRANAFDVFKPEHVKEATRKHPLDEAPFIACDFTRINFGWIGANPPGEETIGMQPDIYEYVCSHAAAWDCPVSMVVRLEPLEQHPRTADNLEVFRRWEDARLSNFFSEEQKEAMKDPFREHILLVDENGKFELRQYEQIEGAARGSKDIRAFVFSRSGKNYVVYSHNSGEGQLVLTTDARNVHLFKEWGKTIPVQKKKGSIVIPAGDRHYLKLDLDKEKIINVFREAELLNQDNQ